MMRAVRYMAVAFLMPMALLFFAMGGAEYIDWINGSSGALFARALRLAGTSALLAFAASTLCRNVEPPSTDPETP